MFDLWIGSTNEELDNRCEDDYIEWTDADEEEELVDMIKGVR